MCQNHNNQQDLKKANQIQTKLFKENEILSSSKQTHHFLLLFHYKIM